MRNTLIAFFPLSKVIAAEGEHQSSGALKEAADVLMGSPFALHLRYLQTLNAISAEKNSTIIFPLPMNFFKQYAGAIGAAGGDDGSLALDNGDSAHC